MAAAHDLRGWEKDTRLFLFTSLTAGSSHIVTATSRLETILKANRIPFQAIDLATDENARRLWGRRAGKKKLPGLVKEGFVIADLEEAEDWNEFGELKENLGPVTAAAAGGPIGFQTAAQTVAPATVPNPSMTKIDHTKGVQSSFKNLSMKEAATQAASIAAARKGPASTINHTKIAPSSLAQADAATTPETMNSSSAAKSESIRTADDTTTSVAEAQSATTPTDKEDEKDTPAAKEDEKDVPASDAQAVAATASTDQAKADEVPLPSDNSAAETAVVEDKELDTPASDAQPQVSSDGDSTESGDVVSALETTSGGNFGVNETKDIERCTATTEADVKEQNITEGQPKTQLQESAAADKASVSVED